MRVMRGAGFCDATLTRLQDDTKDSNMQTPKSPIKRCSYGHETPIGRQNGQSGFGDLGDWTSMRCSFVTVFSGPQTKCVLTR
jgi:hypothetical protein